ncbi:MAG: lytic murein transglycosylase B [Gammaproteobacteria bacterium]|nr:lytic murein transglycosylase B [Gammaproteobacteria bacterium]
MHPLTVPVVLLLAGALSACSASPPRPAGETGASLNPPASNERVADKRPRADAGRSPARPAASGRGDYADHPAAKAMVDRLVREQGFDRGYLEGVLARAERQQWIIDFVTRPSPPPSDRPTGSWTRYRAKFLNEERIARGVEFWRDHEADLERARLRYGVPPEYVVAIIGVETHYGGNMGRHRVIDALATLAFDFPRRAEFFTGELESFLVMTRNEGLDPFAPLGSYAGAMGYGQFMPSSFQRFAVDFDGNGHRDLWDVNDAIGSVANYFREHGWRPDEAVTVPAVARGPEPRLMKADYTTRYSVEDLARSGVTPTGTLSGAGEVSLLRLDAVGGYDYWLGLPNFYVITRYNHSTYYAMAVHQLAQAVRARYDRLYGTVRSARREGPPGPAM